MRVALEVLSRLALRLPPDMVNHTLNLGLDCYRTNRVPQHTLLGDPLRNLLERAWEALSKDNRASRALDLLTSPIAGLDDFSGEVGSPDPGQLVGQEDMAFERTASNDQQFRDVVSFLIRALLASDEAHRRATFRLIPLVLSQHLTEEEESEIARAFWSRTDPILNNSSGPSSPLDWVYFILPEMDKGQAERSFRLKWLSSTPESRGRETDYSSDMLAQVGAAVTGLRVRGRQFALSGDDEQHIATHIERLVEMFTSNSISFRFGIWSTIRQVGSLAAEITLPTDVAQNLFQRVESMIGTLRHPRDPILGPVYDARIGLGFAVIPGLVKALPGRSETLTSWLRTGLASEDDARVRGSMSALRSWLLAPVSSGLRSIPDDLIREVGAIIASDRRAALADALICATIIFDEGSDSQRETVRPLTLQGLSYLAEKLQYDSQQTGDEDLHTLRLLCAQLTTKIASHGFENDAAVAKWLDLGKGDPFPEARRVVMSFESE